MHHGSFPKIKSIPQLYDLLPDVEQMIVDILRQIVSDGPPDYCKEKISYNVPYFYGHKGICIIWPSTVPRGGIKKGVLLGFSHGNKLADKYNYLDKGTNKQVYYKIYKSIAAIDEFMINSLLDEAVKYDITSYNQLIKSKKKSKFG